MQVTFLVARAAGLAVVSNTCIRAGAGHILVARAAGLAVVSATTLSVPLKITISGHNITLKERCHKIFDTFIYQITPPGSHMNRQNGLTKIFIVIDYADRLSV